MIILIVKDQMSFENNLKSSDLNYSREVSSQRNTVQAKVPGFVVITKDQQGQYAILEPGDNSIFVRSFYKMKNEVFLKLFEEKAFELKGGENFLSKVWQEVNQAKENEEKIIALKKQTEKEKIHSIETKKRQENELDRIDEEPRKLKEIKQRSEEQEKEEKEERKILADKEKESIAKDKIAQEFNEWMKKNDPDAPSYAKTDFFKIKEPTETSPLLAEKSNTSINDDETAHNKVPSKSTCCNLI